MPTYHATIRIFDVSGPDRVAAQRVLEERLRGAEVGRWQIVGLEADAPPIPVHRPVRARRSPVSRYLGPLLILGAIGWAIWFYLILME